MSINANRLPPVVLDELEACERALAYWRLCNADSDDYPPGLVAWRERVAALLAEYKVQPIRRKSESSAERFWWYSGRVDEIGFAFETSARLNLPARRRPTLSEYDNRRSGTPLDRYYYGIYGGQYS